MAKTRRSTVSRSPLESATETVPLSPTVVSTTCVLGQLRILVVGEARREPPLEGKTADFPKLLGDFPLLGGRQ